MFFGKHCIGKTNLKVVNEFNDLKKKQQKKLKTTQ